MDDEQGPWWTRPPEPGPQAPVTSRAQEDDEEPDDGIVTPPPAQFDTWGGGFETPPPGANAWDAPPEPEAEPAPVVSPSPIMQPQQHIRRVAVVDPNPPPNPPLDPSGHPSAHLSAHPSSHLSSRVDPADRTETLPALGEDIFAVFDGRGSQRPGAADPSPPAPFDPYGPAPAHDDPLSHLRDEPQPHRLHLPHVPKVQMPEPRFLLMAVGSGLVVLLILLVVLLFDNSGDDPSAAAPAPAAGAGSTVAASLAGKTPDGLKKLSDGQASSLLAKAGEGAKGQIVEAWSWNDKNGHNLVVSTTEAKPGNRQTLRVIHVADLDGDPHTLRVMTDPNLPDCKNKAAVGAAGFTKNSMVVRDLDSDDIAEVTAGWTSRCGARTGTSEIKLALISDGKKFIIRDSGVVGKAGAGSADPKASSWPKGYFSAVDKLFKKLYS